MNTVLQTTVAVQLAALDTKAAIVRKIENRNVNERGEGVISAAIAVMIMAILGVALYAAYRRLIVSAETKTQAGIDGINP
jgi:hypothetical protein